MDLVTDEDEWRRVTGNKTYGSRKHKKKGGGSKERKKKAAT